MGFCVIHWDYLCSAPTCLPLCCGTCTKVCGIVAGRVRTTTSSSECWKELGVCAIPVVSEQLRGKLNRGSGNAGHVSTAGRLVEGTP